MTISNTKWQKAIITIDSSIEEVIHNLDKTALKIVLVINRKGKFEGTISDGDIRRGLLRGLSLKNPIKSIVNYSPLVVKPGISRQFVLQMMIQNKIQQIPVINELNHIEGLHVWDDMQKSSKRSNTVVIMAGGKGSRMQPHTESCPKPMLLIAGKPMLEHIINKAKFDGFERFIISINYLGSQIETYFGDGKNFDIEINYLREKIPLGTAGALGLMTKLKSPFLVINGDVISNVDLSEMLDFHISHSAIATMAVRIHEWQNPFGVVRTQGVEIVDFEEKPIVKNYINAGIYVLDQKVTNVIGKNKYFNMPDLFDALKIQNKKIIAYPVYETWMDVGNPEALRLAHKNLEKKS